MWTPDMNDMIGILIGLSVVGSAGVVWWKAKKKSTPINLPPSTDKTVTSVGTEPNVKADYSQVVKAGPDGTWVPVVANPPTVTYSTPAPSASVATVLSTPSLNVGMMQERYVDRDDFMKDIGATNQIVSIILDGATVHAGVAPALTYFTQLDGSIADKPVAAGLKAPVVEEPIPVEPVQIEVGPYVIDDWPAVPEVPYTPKVQVPLMDTSSSKYAVIMRGPTSIGFNGKVYNNFNELVLAFNAYESESWRWQLVNIQPNYAFLNYLMDCFSGPVMYNFEKAEKANPKRDPNFNPDAKPW